jgi:hypothetical protein
MIASQVSPKENNRSVSGLGKKAGDKVKTDFLPVKKWRALTTEQQANIRVARDRNPEIKKRSQNQKSVLNKKDRKIKNLQKKISALKRHANKEAEEDDGSDDDDANASTNASNAFGGTGQEEEQDVNVAGHPTTTLAGVLVRCSAGVEDRNEESVSRGTQVVEDYFTSHSFDAKHLCQDSNGDARGVGHLHSCSFDVGPRMGTQRHYVSTGGRDSQGRFCATTVISLVQGRQDPSTTSPGRGMVYRYGRRSL